MNNKNWAMEWLKQLRDDVDFLTTMIYATRAEIKSPVLKKAREALEAEVERDVWSKPVLRPAVISRIERVRELLRYAELLLGIAAQAIGKEQSKTEVAVLRTRRLEARITSTIGLVKKALNEKESLYV